MIKQELLDELKAAKTEVNEAGAEYQAMQAKIKVSIDRVGKASDRMEAALAAIAEAI